MCSELAGSGLNCQAMKKNLQKNTYGQLVRDITELYDTARRALVEAYWQIGKRIVEQEQQGEANAIYGDHLLARLSEDLSATLGSGFSERNLRKMRQFYLANEIWPLTAKLTWTQHVELLPLKKSTERRNLERLIVTQNLSQKQIGRPFTSSLRRMIAHRLPASQQGWMSLLWSAFSLPSIPTR